MQRSVFLHASLLKVSQEWVSTCLQVLLGLPQLLQLLARRLLLEGQRYRQRWRGCRALRGSAVHCVAAHVFAVHCVALQCIAWLRTFLPCIAWLCRALRGSAVHCVALQRD